jgi:2-hydroxycyclohexanecarboxyl-CoA dehydrogenase
MSSVGAHTPRDLTESRAVVVGGSSGVGFASAVALARAGVKGIVLVGRDHDRGQAAQQAVTEAGADAMFVAGDAGDGREVERIIAEARQFLGGIEICLNAVATEGNVGPIETMDPIDVVKLLNGVVTPPMLVTREVLLVMREGGGGVILNVASDAAKVPTPGESVVGAGMSAITMFSRTVALEAKRYGVRVNAITPSLIVGTRSSDRFLQEEFASKIFAKIAEKAQLGVPNAEDLANLVVFLASPAAAKITGQVISVNGGISAG